MAFADDLAIVARDRKALQVALEDISVEARTRGLEINQKKKLNTWR